MISLVYVLLEQIKLGNLDKNIPLHLSRYFPTYKMDRSPTEIDVMLEGREIAENYLHSLLK
ncbi:MAG: pyruvate formate lyase activating enzyme [Clostridiales bacterium]|jgi:pyruvate formate lyase activating enzyme|nr:pyruvate formate lyase activating enzyme [Clostridiales bacterium]MDK2933876.1 pyruvate formate lyase activating enzyme [Clostridiales bacterium]